MTNIHTLVQQLRQPGARTGLGVWLLPSEYLGKENEIAPRLNLHPLDARQAYLDLLPKGARFSGLTRPDGHQKLLKLLRSLAGATHPRDCLLVYNLDLLLLGLEVDERERFWKGALEGIPYPSTRLILTLPEKASYLCPIDFSHHYQGRISEGLLE